MTKSTTVLLAVLFCLVSRWATPGETEEEIEKELDAVAEKVFSGQGLTQKERDHAHSRFQTFAAELSRNSELDGPGRSAAHYVNAMKMAVIDPERHGGWPYRHASRREAFSAIRKRMESEDDAALTAAAIIPAIDNGQVDYAVQTYQKLTKRHEKWAQYVLKTLLKFYYRPAAAKEFLAKVYEWKGKMRAGKTEAGGSK